jgi:FkbM family methyltransferase
MILGVPSLWRYELLDRLIASALAGSRVPDEILIVDNGGKYAAKDSRVRVIYSGPNLGVAASWNRLLRAGAWIISNDDVLFKQRTFEELATALEAGKLFVNGLGWALFGQRPEVAEKIGFYDERFYPAYYEDNDYEIRLIDAGIPCLFPVLSEPVEHIGWASSRKREDGELSDPAGHQAIFQKSCQVFVDKWGGPTDRVKEAHLTLRANSPSSPFMRRDIFDAALMPEAADQMPDARVFRPAFSPDSCYILRDDEETSYFRHHGGAPEARLIDWARQLVRADQSFIDVGAHVGSWTQHFAPKAKRIYAFEPQLTTYERLREGVRLAELHNVDCYNVALGIRGEVNLHHVSVYGGGSTLRHRGELGPETAIERVRAAQLDDYTFDAVGLIKIDAEGMEAEILRGAVKTLEAHGYPFLLLEAWLHGWFAKERSALIAQVEALGYRVQPVMNWTEMLLAEHPSKRVRKQKVDQDTAPSNLETGKKGDSSENPPLLGLVMIVKNEVKRIEEVLASYRPYIDTWTILDTGSSDGTQDLIRKLLDGVPGMLHEEPFVDFATSRNHALTLHDTATVFSIMPNGDVLSGGPELRAFLEAHRSDVAGAYRVRIAPGHYYHPLVMRTGAGWRYKWRTHECAMGPNVGPQIPGVVVNRDRGARTDEEWRARWTRDLDLLNRDRTDDPSDPRPCFYLGQTHECLGQYAQALSFFERRAGMGGYFDEVYEAKFRIAKMMDKLERPWPEIQQAYLNAHMHDPRRAEPLHAIAQHWHDGDHHALTRIFAVPAAELPKPPTDLFLDEEVYQWKAADLAAISSFYTGHKDDGRYFAEEAVWSRPRDERLRANRAFYAQSARELFGATAQSIEFVSELGWQASNPSIYRHDDELRCVVRTVNYKLVDGSYIAPDNVIRTRNFLLDLDESLKTTRVVELVDKTGGPRTNFPVRGFEDARLFFWKGQWRATSTVRDFTENGRCEIALLDLDDDGAIVQAEVLRGPWSVHTQKNWMPFVDGDVAKFVYATKPTTIFALTKTDNGYAIEPPADCTFGHGRLRGGSQGARIDGGWIFAVHDVAFPGSSRLYLHRFVLLDDQFQFVSMTDLFYFERLGIEFCAGLAVVGGSLIASYSVNDDSARLAVFDWKAVRRALRKDLAI